MDKDNKVEPINNDYINNILHREAGAPVLITVLKLNELIAAHNALEDRIHSLEINRGRRR